MRTVMWMMTIVGLFFGCMGTRSKRPNPIDLGTASYQETVTYVESLSLSHKSLEAASSQLQSAGFKLGKRKNGRLVLQATPTSKKEDFGNQDHIRFHKAFGRGIGQGSKSVCITCVLQDDVVESVYIEEEFVGF
jgi:hypothetical protein